MGRRASWVFATGGRDGYAEDCDKAALEDRRRLLLLLLLLLLHDYDIQLYTLWREHFSKQHYSMGYFWAWKENG
jgi:hypothetical protein